MEIAHLLGVPQRTISGWLKKEGGGSRESLWRR